MGRLFQPSRSAGGHYSIWWVSYYDRSQRREIRESSGSRSRCVALTLLAQREAEVAARAILKADVRRRHARAADGTRRGSRGRQHHGLSLLRRAVAQLGPRPLDQALDPQSPIGRALAEWRRELTADLGGPEPSRRAEELVADQRAGQAKEAIEDFRPTFVADPEPAEAELPRQRSLDDRAPSPRKADSRAGCPVAIHDQVVLAAALSPVDRVRIAARLKAG
jgi:hypothetical protein